MGRLRKLLPALLAAACLAGHAAGAEEPEMSISLSGDPVLPGEAVVVSFMVPEDGTCSIDIIGSDGETAARVTENRKAVAGYNAFYWNGTWQGVPVAPGKWTVRLTMNGRQAETEITVGEMIPALIGLEADRSRVIPGKLVNLEYWATEAGTLTVDAGGKELLRIRTEAGQCAASFAAELAAGEYTAEARLTAGDGRVSRPTAFPLTVEAPAEKFTPLGKGAGEDLTLNGWTVPMDIRDEEAVWQALMAPVTVVDDGEEKAQVRQAVIRKEPRADSDGVGTVTLASQGVYVLERGAEWSKIACYSSSFHDSPVANWNARVEGYVETRLLRTIRPDGEMGLVVDKLTQRMYVFTEGKLYSTLMVSTGKSNERQPYNETRSGEFLLVSKVGGFYSDNMFCPRAIRFNDGDLLHEVPYVERNGNIIYSATEPQLGTKASHGCVRVQRRKNPEGLNMAWIFNHYRENTKILIWEDWQGRQVPVPEDGTVFWWHPKKNSYYHCSPECPLLDTKTPEEITYGELSAEDSGLDACPACGPVMKKGELTEYNAMYAEGGDHDPVMTEARKDCPKPGRR